MGRASARPTSADLREYYVEGDRARESRVGRVVEDERLDLDAAGRTAEPRATHLGEGLGVVRGAVIHRGDRGDRAGVDPERWVRGEAVDPRTRPRHAGEALRAGADEARSDVVDLGVCAR